MSEQVLRSEVDIFNRVYWAMQEFEVNDLPPMKFCKMIQRDINIEQECQFCGFCDGKDVY